MHVVLLNQAFHPDVVATAQMSKDLADELVRRGHRVTAVASRSIYGKKGAVLAKREVIDGIDVRRPGLSLFGKAGYAARIADFAFFYMLAALRVLTLHKPDVVVSFTTPPFVAGVGVLSRWLRGSKAVYWVMDLYPDLPVACGVMKPRGAATWFFERVNRFVLKRSHVDVVLGRCMRDRVIGKGVPAERVRLIPVWADLTGISGTARSDTPFRESWKLGDVFTVMYSGNFGIGHDAQTICRAMLQLRDRADIRFVFVGGGKRRAEVEAFIAEHKLSNAAWFDYVKREDLGLSLAAGDVHLISLKEGVEGIMVPSKLFGIMAAGRPGVFVGHPTSEISRVLTEHGCGLTVRQGDAAGLVKAILELKNDPARCAEMGRRARQAVPGRYDRQCACAQFADLLEEVAAGRTAPADGPGPASTAPSAAAAAVSGVPERS